MCSVAVTVRDYDIPAGDHNLSPCEVGMPMIVTSGYSNPHIAEVLFVSRASLTWMRAR